MKKLLLTVTLVALLAVAVLGGQALASNKPTEVTVSEEASQEILFDWGSSYRGYPVHMKTLSGSVETDGWGSAQWETLLEETYSGVRHVSLSILIMGIDDPTDEVRIGTNVTESGYSFYTDIESTENNGYKTYEFDVDNWKLEAMDYAGNLFIEVYYWATITYPSNQW